MFLKRIPEAPVIHSLDSRVRTHCKVSSTKFRTTAPIKAQASSSNPYQVAGRFGHKELAPIQNVRVGGDDELPIFAKIQPTLPAAPGLHDIPLIVISSGFLLPSSVYTSYANHLASHGYAVIRYDLSEVMDDVETLSALRAIIDAVLRDNRVGSLVDPKCLVLLGHSRGAKLSCLLAEREERVKGMVLLDPVDNTSMTPAGDGFPTSLPSLKRATQMRSLPVLVVGAAMNGDIIPAEGNYKRFCDMCFGPFWEVDLLGAGHLSFLDEQKQMDPFSRMASMIGSPPTTPAASVSAVTKVAAAAWLQEVVVPYAAPSCGRTSAPPPLPPKELETSLYNKIVNIELPQGKAPRRSIIRGLGRCLERQLPQGATHSSKGSSRSSSASSTYSRSEESRDPRSRPTAMLSTLCGMSPDELRKLPATELKSGLMTAGVKCDDCFEKEELVKLALQACSKPT